MKAEPSQLIPRKQTANLEHLSIVTGKMNDVLNLSINLPENCFLFSSRFLVARKSL